VLLEAITLKPPSKGPTSEAATVGTSKPARLCAAYCGRRTKIGHTGGANTSERVAEDHWLGLQFNHRDRLRAFAIPYGANPATISCGLSHFPGNKCKWRCYNSNPYLLCVGKPSRRSLYDGFPYEMDRSCCIAAVCAVRTCGSNSSPTINEEHLRQPGRDISF